MKEKSYFAVFFVAALFLILMTGNVLAQEIAPVDTVVQPEVTPAPTPQPEVTPAPTPQPEVTPAPAPQPTEPVIEEVVPEEEVVQEEVPQEEAVKEEPSKFKPGWTAKAYVNFGPIEPWGDPGSGALFNMGMRIQGGAQLNIGNWVKLPLIFQPLTAEVMVGYGMWNIKPDYTGVYVDGKTNVISVLALGRYDLTDLIMKAIGVEYPALGIFGVAGLQYNMQSWDFPNWTREFDPVSQFGLNLGVGVKYNLQNLIGKPVEVDLRFTQGVFIMGDVKDQNGDPFYPDADYKHTENGILIGIGYPF